jgi:cell division protein FtsI/penicillin-binding protein 2
VLRSYRIPFGAAAVVSVADGKVLALAGRSERDATLGPAELALRPWAPAASVFKVVTASALVANGGVSASTRVCYHGGVSAVLPDNLVDVPKLDGRCDTLAWGVGKSQNAIIAKLATRHLTPVTLARTAEAFGFNAPLLVEAETEPSTLDVPAEPLEFARTAAGFYHSSLSVLHGALLAATIAGRGQMPTPRLVVRAVDDQGRPVAVPVHPARRVLPPEVADEVGRMMQLTTRTGTAKRAFRDRRGHPLLPVEVAGKTGTLNFRGRDGDPALPVVASELDGGTVGYSWFVGYAPADKPRIAFAVLLGNQASWRIKATFLARRLVAEQLALDGNRRASRMLASR